MFEWLVRAVLDFVSRYGYLAVFLYMVLETSFLLHFVPSEVVVPFAAAALVHDPASFVLFVAVTTAGATLGSLLAYEGFGRYGERLVERYGRVVHVSERDLERGQRVFVTYGESSVFWGRLLPFLRALISIPAGFAGMDLRRFVVYSAAGAGLFNTGLTYLVYTGSDATSPLGVAFAHLRTALALEVRYVTDHVAFVLVLFGLFALVAAVAWYRREWIRSNPEEAAHLALHAIRLVGLLVGGAFVLGALSSPARAFGAVTRLWDDPTYLVGLGFTEQVALLLTGVLVAVGGLIAYELGSLFRPSHVRELVDRLPVRHRR